MAGNNQLCESIASVYATPVLYRRLSMRFDRDRYVGYFLVLSSDTRSIAEIQDLALFRVRPSFSCLTWSNRHRSHLEAVLDRS